MALIPLEATRRGTERRMRRGAASRMATKATCAPSCLRRRNLSRAEKRTAEACRTHCPHPRSSGARFQLCLDPWLAAFPTLVIWKLPTRPSRLRRPTSVPTRQTSPRPRVLANSGSSRLHVRYTRPFGHSTGSRGSTTWTAGQATTPWRPCPVRHGKRRCRMTCQGP